MDVIERANATTSPSNHARTADAIDGSRHHDAPGDASSELAEQRDLRDYALDLPRNTSTFYLLDGLQPP